MYKKKATVILYFFCNWLYYIESYRTILDKSLLGVVKCWINPKRKLLGILSEKEINRLLILSDRSFNRWIRIFFLYITNEELRTSEKWLVRWTHFFITCFVSERCYNRQKSLLRYLLTFVVNLKSFFESVIIFCVSFSCVLVWPLLSLSLSLSFSFSLSRMILIWLFTGVDRLRGRAYLTIHGNTIITVFSTTVILSYLSRVFCFCCVTFDKEDRIKCFWYYISEIWFSYCCWLDKLLRFLRFSWLIQP